jgi:large subunit ribosomal protein L31
MQYLAHIPMKTDIHPTYYSEAKVVCACGNTFTTGSTVEVIHTEICSKCHPFFTGTQKLVDSARRVDKFHKRVEKMAEKAKARKGRAVKRAKRTAEKAKKPTSKKIVVEK